MLAVSKKPLSVLYKAIETKYGRSAFKRVDIPLNKPIVDKTIFAEKLKKKLPKNIIGNQIAETKTYDGLKIILNDDSWLLLRPSGTEPLLRTYAETDSEQKTLEFLAFAKKIVAHIAS